MHRRMIFEIEPMGAPRQTQRDRWKKRPVIVRYHAFRDELRLQAREADYTVSERLSATFILPMPASWSKKKKAAMDGKPHQQKPDLDNLIKAFQDALCQDDSFVCEYASVKKVWGYFGSIVVIVEGDLLQ